MTPLLWKKRSSNMTPCTKEMEVYRFGALAPIWAFQSARKRESLERLRAGEKPFRSLKTAGKYKRARVESDEPAWKTNVLPEFQGELDNAIEHAERKAKEDRKQISTRSFCASTFTIDWRFQL